MCTRYLVLHSGMVVHVAPELHVRILIGRVYALRTQANKHLHVEICRCLPQFAPTQKQQLKSGVSPLAHHKHGTAFTACACKCPVKDGETVLFHTNICMRMSTQFPHGPRGMIFGYKFIRHTTFVWSDWISASCNIVMRVVK